MRLSFVRLRRGMPWRSKESQQCMNIRMKLIKVSTCLQSFNSSCIGCISMKSSLHKHQLKVLGFLVIEQMNKCYNHRPSVSIIHFIINLNSRKSFVEPSSVSSYSSEQPVLIICKVEFALLVEMHNTVLDSFEPNDYFRPTFQTVSTHQFQPAEHFIVQHSSLHEFEIVSLSWFRFSQLFIQRHCYMFTLFQRAELQVPTGPAPLRQQSTRSQFLPIYGRMKYDVLLGTEKTCR
mmetsp:Transcript_11754/g.21268  ORF Transcript_11754/g.21268 Transcript_11754/m.21268 type:complete len:234 (-) Transcript_11754:1081-1782(-)